MTITFGFGVYEDLFVVQRARNDRRKIDALDHRGFWKSFTCRPSGALVWIPRHYYTPAAPLALSKTVKPLFASFRTVVVYLIALSWENRLIDSCICDILSARSF